MILETMSLINMIFVLLEYLLKVPTIGLLVSLGNIFKRDEGISLGG